MDCQGRRGGGQGGWGGGGGVIRSLKLILKLLEIYGLEIYSCCYQGFQGLPYLCETRSVHVLTRNRHPTRIQLEYNSVRILQYVMLGS